MKNILKYFSNPPKSYFMPKSRCELRKSLKLASLLSDFGVTVCFYMFVSVLLCQCKPLLCYAVSSFDVALGCPFTHQSFYMQHCPHSLWVFPYAFGLSFDFIFGFISVLF